MLEDAPQECSADLGGRSSKELSGRRVLDDATFGEESDVVGDMPGKAHLVSHENEIASISFQFLDYVEHLGGHLRI